LVGVGVRLDGPDRQRDKLRRDLESLKIKQLLEVRTVKASYYQPLLM